MKQKLLKDNRSQLLSECGLQDAQWLEQVHGIECVKAVRNKEVLWRMPVGAMKRN